MRAIAILLLTALAAFQSFGAEKAVYKHYVPEEKDLAGHGFVDLSARGQRKVYRGAELETIGMPCGGIGAGQLYVRGDGTLAQWWISNEYTWTGYGYPMDCNTSLGKHTTGYRREPYRPVSPIQQGFAVQATGPQGKVWVKELSREGFDDIGFIGEYPVATIVYRDKGSDFPLRIEAEVFTPWIPLATRDSANPATVLQYRLTNAGSEPFQVTLAGWLQKFGDMTLAGRGAAVKSFEALESVDGALEALVHGKAQAAEATDWPGQRDKFDALGTSLSLAGGQTKTATFFITWYFPGRVLQTQNQFPENGTEVGNMYENWYKNSADVASYMDKHFERLYRETMLFRDTYHDTTLPYWFANRIIMPVSCLATNTSQWWRNGRFWGFEGSGCCFGTCGHVYNYAQAHAWLFPELARTVRLMQDLGPGFDETTGRISYRGVKGTTADVVPGAWGYAADAQCGYVLKFYREHLLSADRKFLDDIWPKVKQAMEYLISRDGNSDGVIEDKQHTTWDTNLFGANSYVGTWYLAALRAAEEMARLEDDESAAKRYRRLYESGRRFALEKLWNGEYFIHVPPQEEHDPATTIEYTTGCLSDQLLGQNWAHTLDLGYLYPAKKIRKTLASVYRYNWAPDVGYDPNYPQVGPRHQGFPNPRVFAFAGEPGLFVLTWPDGKWPKLPVLHNPEIWTASEYQVGAHMLYEGMVEKAMNLVRGVDLRHNGANRNPWDEIECGDHYARAMSSWGCLLGASGYIYDGPAGKIGFAPRLTPEDFKCFFSGAQGWGSLVQQRQGKAQTNAIEVKWGRLRVKSLVLELPEAGLTVDVRVQVAGDTVGSQVAQDGRRITVALAREVVVEAGQRTEVVMCWE